MSMAWFLALQAAQAPAASTPLPVQFDLAKVPPANDCGRGESSDIVVCGRRVRGEGYPYEEMERLFRTKPLVAEMGIGGGATARAFVESVEMPGGQISKRAMIGTKLPF